MTRGDIPRRTFMGRPIKPLVFAIAMSMTTIFWFNIVEREGLLVPSVAGNIIGYCAGASAVLLFAAWWICSQRLSETGLLLAAGVWVARTSLILLLDDWHTYPFFFSLCWCLASVGAYLLEVFDPEERNPKWIR